MGSRKKTFLKFLDMIANQQREISECYEYYQRLEKEIEQKRMHLANPEDLSDLSRNSATLNREFEEKIDHMYENLNQALIKGYDLAKEIGKEVAHDFKQLWDYMTDSIHQEVQLKRVLKEVEQIKKDFLD